MDGTLGMGELEVLAGPALLERCQQGAKETYDQAEKPDRIDPDCRGWRLPVCLGQRRTRSPVCKGAVGETIELSGYLGEEDDGVSCGVWQQGLVTIDDEGGECRCEQSCL